MKRLLFLLSLTAGALQAVTPSVNLGGPLVSKINWNLRSLNHADLNGDELEDLLVIDNDEGRIWFLLQQKPGEELEPLQKDFRPNRWDPELENAPYAKEDLVTGLTMYAVTAGDLNGDGLADLAYTAKQDPLTIRYQLPEGGFGDPLTYSNFEPASWIATLRIEDLDSDGQAELIVLGKDHLLIFAQKEEGKGLNMQPRSIGLTDEVAYGLDVCDINGDKLGDLIYLRNNVEEPFVIRFQREDGHFGPEKQFPAKVGADVVYPLQINDADAPNFVYLRERSNELKLFSVEQGGQADVDDKLKPDVYTLGIADGAASSVFGDVDGDARADVLVAGGGEASLAFYRQREDGSFEEPVDYPTLSSVTRVAIGHFGGEGQTVVVFSEREELLGLSRFSDKRLGFPQPMTLEGKPLAMAVGNVDREGRDELLVLTKVKKEHELHVHYFDEAGELERTETVSIDNIKRSPDDLQLVDLDGDERLDLIVLIPREAARLFQQQEDGLFASVDAHAAISKGLLNNLSADQVGLWVDAEEGSSLLVARKGYVRALRLDGEGRVEIVDQFNARHGEDSLQVPFTLDIDGDEKPELLGYDGKKGSLQVLIRGEDGVYRFSHEIEIGHIDPTQLVVDEQPSGRRLMVFGPDRFWSVPLEGNQWDMQEAQSYESDLKDVHYHLMAVGDLNGDGLDEIAAVDGHEHMLEVLSFEGDGFLSRLHFTVFDENLHYQGRKGTALEPREILTADVSGDGREDVIILVHDRVLVYPQLAMPPGKAPTSDE